MKCGYLYVATGKKYREEAWKYSEGLRQRTKLPICLITDAPPEQPRWWNDLILVENPAYSYTDKWFMQHSPYERTLFLDTDTWVAREIDGLFDLLDHYDLAASQLGEGHQYTIPEVPHSFPEFNTGVTLFSRQVVEKKFFDTWKQHHLEWRKIGPGRGLAPFDIASDQLSFRLAVYQSSQIRTHVLPPEYNFMGVFPSYAVMDLFIIHHRPLEEILGILRVDHPEFHHRIYLPSQGLFIGERMDRKSIQTLFFRIAGLWCKEILRSFPLVFSVLKYGKRLWK